MALIPTEEILEQFLEDMRRDILAEYRGLGFRASGQTEQELTVELQGFKGEVKGPEYMFAMIQGRGPGGFPPIEDIRDWIVVKGITPDGISIDSLAFLFARKIARQGTEVFEGKRPGIDLDEIREKRTDEVVKIIARQAKLNTIANVSQIVNRGL